MARTSHGTLTAGVVSTVSIDSFMSQITVINRSQAGEIYFTLDGTTPVVGAAGTYVCLGAKALATPVLTSATTVSLRSTTALDYSVEGVTQ